MPSVLNETPLQKLAPNPLKVPSHVLKQIRGTLALRYYDYIFEENTMKIQEQQRKIYNYFHRNKDQNILS